MGTVRTKGSGIGTKSLWPFFGITFGLCWGLGTLMVTVPTLTDVFGPMGYSNPVFILMVWAPAIAAFGLVVRHYGVRGVGRFLRRMSVPRLSARWWGLLLLGIPTVFYLAATIAGTFPAPFPFSPWHAAIPALATTLAIGPMEEFGWRGVALPLLQRRFSPFVASLVLGTVWAVWHAPSFFMSGTPQSGWSFGSFFLGVLAVSVILTALFNAARGSLLVALAFHFMLNNPVWPDAQPWDAVLLTVVAAAVVITHRTTMFARGAGATEVVPPFAEATADSTLRSGPLREAAAHPDA